jgi:hypothetical protein
MAELNEVQCGDCDAVIRDEPFGTPPDKREPCPNCGSRRRRFRVEVISSAQFREEALSQLATASPGDVQQIAAAQIRLLESYYQDGLAQARRSFNWALIAAGIGLAFFLAAVTFLLITQAAPVAVPVAVVSAIGGALVEVVAGINFFLYSKTTTQLAAFHQHLDQTQRFLLANNICESLEGDTKQSARASLINTIATANLAPSASTEA